MMKTEKTERRHVVGQRLQDIRGQRDQRTFAEAVESVQQTISKYERGEIPRSWLFLARLHEQEGVDLNALLAGDGVGRNNGKPVHDQVIGTAAPQTPALTITPGEQYVASSF